MAARYNIYNDCVCDGLGIGSMHVVSVEYGQIKKAWGEIWKDLVKYQNCITERISVHPGGCPLL